MNQHCGDIRQHRGVVDGRSETTVNTDPTTPNRHRFTTSTHRRYHPIHQVSLLSHHCNALNSLICADVPLRNYSLTHPPPGAQPRFQSWGIQFLGLGYCTEQNTDGTPSFVHCSLQLRKKLGWSVQILGGPDPLDPQWLRPCPHHSQQTPQI